MDASPAPRCHPPKRPWFQNKLFLAALVLSALVFLSYVYPAFAAFRENLSRYFYLIWWAILLGFFLGGVIDRFVPQSAVSAYLAAPKKRTIFYAVVLGFLMSGCSHGILALAVELHRKGASTAVVVSFLLGSPWMSLPITLLLFGFFGIHCLLILLGAMVIAFLVGIAFQALERKGWVEANRHTAEVRPDFSLAAELRAKWRGYRLSPRGLWEDAAGVASGALRLADMTLWWILLGIGLSSLAATLVPPAFFQDYMGPDLPGLLATLGFATVIEVCSEGTAPLAFEIYRQTRAFGNAFVFLMAGVVTDITEIGLLWVNVGRRAAVWMVVLAVPLTLLFGFFLNRLPPLS